MATIFAKLDPDAFGTTINAEQLGELLGVRAWAVYRMVKAGTCPVRPIHVGRLLRFSTAEALALVGIAPAA